MESSDFSKLLRRKTGTILTVVFVACVLTLGVSLAFPLKYGAKSRLLVIQNTAGADPYTISRSHEYLGKLMAQIVYSSSFYNLTLESPYDIERSYFSGNYNKQMEQWLKTVNTRTISDTGIIEINVYHPHPAQAQQIALAVNDLLVNKNALYQGDGKQVQLKVIDQPLVSPYPVKPNILRNILVAFSGSLLVAIFYIYLWPEERYDLRLWKKKAAKRVHLAPRAPQLDYLPVVEDENQAMASAPLNRFQPQGDINNIFRQG